jgi:xanthine dehydrogenase YagS FAD-binding subunit
VRISHAVLGASDSCIAVHPSDMCVALAALDVIVDVEGPGGSQRQIPFGEFHVAYGEDPARETTLRPGELITFVELPAVPFAVNSTYLKVRDRESYEFALVSVAVALDVQNGTVQQARIALGGVATKPWRSLAGENALVGQHAEPKAFQAAAQAAMRDAVPREHNAFKIDLARRAIVRALTSLAEVR